MATIIGISANSPKFSRDLKKNGLMWKLNRGFSREYTILADRLDESQKSVLKETPHVGEIENGCMCKSVEVTESENVLHPKTRDLTALYKVTCSFDSDCKLDPIELPPTIQWGAETMEIAMETDLTGKRIQTVNGERLEASRQIICPTLSIGMYSLTFDPNIQVSYANHLNSQTFWGAAPKTALLEPIQYDFVQIELTDEVKNFKNLNSDCVAGIYSGLHEESYRIVPSSSTRTLMKLAGALGFS